LDKKQILIVEDEKNLVEVMKSRLTNSGYDVAIARDGEQGLAMAKELKPDLIILDLMLPKLNGYEVCGALKMDDEYNTIPVIMLTAKTQERDKKIGYCLRRRGIFNETL